MTDQPGKERGWPVRLTLPLPVSMNQIWRKSKSGQIYLKPEGHRYKTRVRRAVAAYMRYRGIERTKGLVVLKMWVYWPDMSRRRDVGNTEKLLADGIEGILYENDHQVFPQFVPPHRVDPDHPRIEIEASLWDGEDSSPGFSGYTTHSLAALARRQVESARARKRAAINKGAATRAARKQQKAEGEGTPQ